MRTIYNGGFLPELAIDDDKDSRYWGWLMAKNPADGRWVSLANMSLQITNAVFECEPSDAEALKATIAELEARLATAEAEVVRLKEAGIPTLLWCPRCGQPHIDRGLWVSVPHRTHYCNYCCTEWRPFEVATYGCEVDEIRHRITSMPTHAPVVVP